MPPHDDAILPSESSSQNCHPGPSMGGDVAMESSQEMTMEVSFFSKPFLSFAAASAFV